MKRPVGLLYFTIAALTLGMTGDEFKNERVYGGEFADARTATIAEILANSDSYDKVEVVFEGTIKEVCQNKGCWMFVTDAAQKIRVDFKNYSFFVPWESEGKRVRVQGKVYTKLVDKNVAMHWAEDQESPDVKPENIKEDQLMTLVTASAVAIENGSGLSKEQEDVLSGKVQKER